MTDQDLAKQAVRAIESAKDLAELEQLRVKYLGRKGLITVAIAAVGTLPQTKRADAGQAANRAKQAVTAALQSAKKHLVEQKVASESQSQDIDITAPVRTLPMGHLHPLSPILQSLIYQFWQMGFEVVDGPEVEDQWHNFEALNIPADHPARDMQDTFYIAGEDFLPRTHTSNMQIRYMEEHKPPIRIISPGKVYRNEDEDPRHAWMFYQLEGLVVDKGINLGHLKGTLLALAQGIFGPKTQIRLRPSFFPYVEPAVEVDATCVCQAKDPNCRVCGGTGWLELLGAGMVHPQVLANVGIDPSIYSGFAFGVGLERLAVIKYQITDLRELWRPNLKFLEQF